MIDVLSFRAIPRGERADTAEAVLVRFLETIAQTSRPMVRQRIREGHGMRLTLVVSSLDCGGTERVRVSLANAGRHDVMA